MKKMSYLAAVVFAIGIISGCAAVTEKLRSKGAPGFVTGGVESLVIQGATRSKVGKTFTLKARGYDAKQAKIKVPGMVKPTWKVEDTTICSLSKKKGESVKVKALRPGTCYITAKQGKAEATFQTEIQ